MTLLDMYYWSMMGSIVSSCIALLIIDEDWCVNFAPVLMVQAFIPIVNTVLMILGIILMISYLVIEGVLLLSTFIRRNEE